MAALPFSAGICQVNSNENNALPFTVNNVEYMRISGTAGNVGIGTTNPLAKLTVAGDISSAGVVQVSGSSLTCSSAVKGAIRYSNTSSTLEYCNSTAWTSVGPSTSMPAFMAYKGANQTVTTASLQRISFASEAFDTNSNFSACTTNCNSGAQSASESRFTPTVPGKYFFTSQVTCNDGTQCYSFIGKNGALLARSTGAVNTANTSIVLDMGVGDYVEAYVWNSGGTSIIGTDPQYTSFSGFMLGGGGGSGSGGIATPAGSTGDIQFNNAGALAADTGQLFWDATNNRLGIQTNSPAAILEVSGSEGLRLSKQGGTANSPFIRWHRNGTSQAYMGWGTPGTDFDLAMENGNRLNLIASTTYVSGNVGIGTTGPGSKLHVASGRTQIGSTATNYAATGGDWNFNLLIDAADTSSIGFHDAGHTVGMISFYAGTFKIGADAGWGNATVIAAPPMMIAVDQKAAATGGGTCTSGSWFTRTLNTERVNTISGASLASNQITLPAGKYLVRAASPAYRVDRYSTRLWNVTDGTEAITGATVYSSNVDSRASISSQILGQIDISGSKTFRIEARCDTSYSSANALGLTTTFGNAEVHSTIEITQIR